LEAIQSLYQKGLKVAGEPAVLGFGTPGAIDPETQLLKNSNSVVLNGRDLKADLEALIQKPVLMENDANCLALSEAVDGAAAGKSVVFGVILGTGCGGGLVYEGKVWWGAQAIAGEWGHNPLPWPEPSELPGLSCYCGLAGCIETWISGSGVQRQYAELTGEALGAKEIFHRSREGQSSARQIAEKFYTHLAKSLASVINILDPEVIVLGGGLSQVPEIYQKVPQRWESWVFSSRIKTQLLPPRYGDSSGVRGAAWLGRGIS
jgi:fructokinase